MDAFALGPMVLPAPRFFAVLALAVLVFVAELVVWTARREQRQMAERDGLRVDTSTLNANWAWSAALVAVLASRVGFVFENIGYFWRDPIGIIRFWEGGFSSWWGVVGGAITVVHYAVNGRVPLRVALPPVVLALAAWLVIPPLLTPAEARTRTLPNTMFQQLAGAPTALTEFVGEPLVVNLWATWCGPCRREMPMMAEVAGDEPGVAFVFANQAESAAQVNHFLSQELGLHFAHVLLDSRASLPQAFATIGLPVTLFFSADGSFVRVHSGQISEPQLRSFVRELHTHSP